MWVSSTETSWQDFRKPLIAVADAKTPTTQIIRAVSVVLLPFLVGFLGWNNMKPSIDEPIELRTVHPAPPASTRSEEHTSELQSPCNLVCRLLLEKKKKLVVPTRSRRGDALPPQVL